MSLENPGDRSLSSVEKASTSTRREHNKKLVEEGARVVDGEFRVTPKQMDTMRVEMESDRANSVHRNMSPYRQDQARFDYEDSMDHQRIRSIKSQLLELRQLVGIRYANFGGRLGDDLDERDARIGTLCDGLGYSLPGDKTEGQTLVRHIEAKIAECDSMDMILLHRVSLRIGSVVRIEPEENAPTWKVRDIATNGQILVVREAGDRGDSESRSVPFADLLRANP